MPIYTSPNSSIVGYYVVIDDVFQNEISNLNSELDSFVDALDINFSFDANNIISQVESVLNLPSPREFFSNALDSLLQSAGAHVRLFSLQGLLDRAYSRLTSIAQQVLRDLGVFTGDIGGLIDFFDLEGTQQRTTTHDFDNFFEFAFRGTAEFLSILPDFTGDIAASQVRNVVRQAEDIQGYIEDIQNIQQNISQVATQTQEYITEILQQISNVDNGALSYFDSDLIGEATAIIVAYQDGSLYQWTIDRVGNDVIDTMIELAESNSGLGSYIYHNVRYDYS